MDEQSIFQSFNKTDVTSDYKKLSRHGYTDCAKWPGKTGNLGQGHSRSLEIVLVS